MVSACTPPILNFIRDKGIGAARRHVCNGVCAGAEPPERGLLNSPRTFRTHPPWWRQGRRIRCKSSCRCKGPPDRYTCRRQSSNVVGRGYDPVRAWTRTWSSGHSTKCESPAIRPYQPGSAPDTLESSRQSGRRWRGCTRHYWRLDRPHSVLSTTSGMVLGQELAIGGAIRIHNVADAFKPRAPYDARWNQVLSVEANCCCACDCVTLSGLVQ